MPLAISLLYSSVGGSVGRSVTIGQCQPTCSLACQPVLDKGYTRRVSYLQVSDTLAENVYI